MTGSDVGQPATHRSSVSIALGQLRKLVSFCSLILVLAIVAQGSVWAIVTFGDDVRYTSLESADAPVLVASGVTTETVSDTLERAHGVIVGSHIMRNGRAGTGIDPERARAFVERARG